jgi:hypothetical protein
MWCQWCPSLLSSAGASFLFFDNIMAGLNPLKYYQTPCDLLKVWKLSNLRKIENATFSTFVPKPHTDISLSSAYAEFYKNTEKRNGVGHGFQDYVSPNSDRFTLKKVHPLQAFLLRPVRRQLADFLLLCQSNKNFCRDLATYSSSLFLPPGFKTKSG